MEHFYQELLKYYNYEILTGKMFNNVESCPGTISSVNVINVRLKFREFNFQLNVSTSVYIT